MAAAAVVVGAVVAARVAAARAARLDRVAVVAAGRARPRVPAAAIPAAEGAPARNFVAGR